MSISHKGVVDVVFTDKLVVVTNLTTINSTVLEVEIVKGEYETNTTLFGFKWNLTEFNAFGMQL